MRSDFPAGRALMLFAVATIAAIAASVVLLAWEMRIRALERSQLDTLSTAYMLREQTERAFEGVDAAIRGVRERMQSTHGAELALDDEAVHLMLRTRSFGTPHLKALTLVDLEGVTRNSSRAGIDGAPLAAVLPAFKVFHAGGAGDLYVDEPVRDPADGAWTVTVARPLHDARGRLRGMVAATMEIPGFDHFHRWLKLQPVRPMALYMDDGTLLASLPHRDSFIGEPAAELSGFRVPVQDSQIRMVTHVRGDGSHEALALGRVGSFPLLVSVTDDPLPALAGWREAMVPIALGAVLICLSIGVMAAVLARELAKRAALSEAARAADLRYHRTVDSLSDACLAVDSAQDIVLFNPAAERMFGIERKEAVGSPLARILPPHAVAAHPGFMRQYAASGDGSSAMSPKGDVLAVRSDGTEFPVEITISQTGSGHKKQFTAIVRDITQRRLAESELREANRQLRELSAALQDVREEERARIAAELHDELGQRLTGLKLELSWIAGRQLGRPDTALGLESVRRQVDEAIASVRRIATELRPIILDELGFAEAVSWLASEYERASTLSVGLELAAADLVDSDKLRVAMFRMVQEALTNVVRHSAGTRATVQLLRSGDSLVLRVRDNGRGFREETRARGFGLVAIRERAMALGGEMRLVSEPGKGVLMEVTIPLPRPSSPVRESMEVAS